MYTKIDEFSLVIRVKEENYDDDNFEWYKIADMLIDDVVALLEIEQLVGKKEISGVGLQSYNVSMRYGEESPIYIGYHNTYPRQGLLFRFTSSSLDRLPDHNYKIIQRVFDYASKKDYLESHLTRIDLAVDFINSDYSLDRIAEKLNNGAYEIRSEAGRLNRSSRKTIRSEQGFETIYIGSRKTSSSLLRIYDKKLEQIQTGGRDYSYALTLDNWLRFEAEFRNEYSRQIGKKILEINSDEECKAFICSMISQRYNFILKDTGNYTAFTSEVRRGMVDKEFGELLLENGELDSLDKKKDYFLTGDSGLQSLLYLLRKGLGENVFEKYIEEIVYYQKNHFEPSERYKRIAKEMKNRQKYKKK